MKQRKELIALAVLLILAFGIWRWQWATPSVATGIPATAFLESYQLMSVVNPEIQWQVLENRRKTEYKSSGRDPFTTIAPPTAEEKKKAADDQKKAQETAINTPPPAPAAPELPPNVKFFGYGTVPNGTARRAFLTDGDEVYIVGEGDTLMGRYRIVKIGNANLEFEEISSNRRGSKSIEDLGPSA